MVHTGIGISVRDNERLRRIVIDRLQSLQQAGVMQLPRAAAALLAEPEAAPSHEDNATLETQLAETQPATRQQQQAVGIEIAVKERGDMSAVPRTAGRESLIDELENSDGEVANVPNLGALQQIVSGCPRCGELAATRTQTVFGVGNPNARLCFLGEAPGADEDRLGEPFVGRGGQLLTKIIEACKLKREDVYILNMIKCRPPGNRNPLPTELANCRGYLDRLL